jgi:hypothetical protein
MEHEGKTMLIDFAAYTQDFVKFVGAEIERIQGGNRHVWNDCGTFTKLLLPEVMPLASRYVGRFVELDPAKAMEYLAAFPETLDKTAPGEQTVKQVIVGAVQDVVAERLASSPEIRKLVLAQWDSVTLDELSIFTEGYVTRLKKDSSSAGLKEHYSVDNLDCLKVVSSLFDNIAYGDEFIWSDLERKGKEYQEFIALIETGEFDFDALQSNRTVAMA